MAISENVLKYLEQAHPQHYQKFMTDVTELFGVYLETDELQDDSDLWDLLKKECDTQKEAQMRAREKRKAQKRLRGALLAQHCDNTVSPLNETWAFCRELCDDPALIDRLLYHPGVKQEKR